jgi:DNA-binding response OmpR family regulator
MAEPSSSGMNEPQDTAMAAVADDRLLEGEDPQTEHPGDARRWMAAYTELLAYKESVFIRTSRAIDELGKDSAAEIAGTDLEILGEERDRFRRRLGFWQRRVRELGGGIDFDREVRLVRHQGQAIRFSRREAELLSFLLENPGRRFTPRELADQAWLAPNLSQEQVRNYVVRLRRKLSGAELPCTLVSEPGTGYSLKWS